MDVLIEAKKKILDKRLLVENMSLTTLACNKPLQVSSNVLCKKYGKRNGKSD
jgi:hypothetical protein